MGENRELWVQRIVGDKNSGEKRILGDKGLWERQGIVGVESCRMVWKIVREQ